MYVINFSHIFLSLLHVKDEFTLICVITGSTNIQSILKVVSIHHARFQDISFIHLYDLAKTPTLPGFTDYEIAL